MNVATVSDIIVMWQSLFYALVAKCNMCTCTRSYQFGKSLALLRGRDVVQNLRLKSGGVCPNYPPDHCSLLHDKHG